MKNQTTTLIGATGLIGSQVLELLLKDESYQTIKVLVRRPVSFNHPKIQIHIIDFANDSAFKKAIEGSDAVFCAVGTTNKKVKGDKIAYRKVDFDIPVRAAKFSSETGCSQFLLISSVGADSKSGNFYLQMKGEVEDIVKNLNIPSISVFRPSMLLGKRQEFRLGEKIGQVLMIAFSFLIPSKYKPINASDVAQAMVSASRNKEKGFRINHFGEMKKLIGV